MLEKGSACKDSWRHREGGGFARALLLQQGPPHQKIKRSLQTLVYVVALKPGNGGW